MYGLKVNLLRNATISIAEVPELQHLLISLATKLNAFYLGLPIDANFKSTHKIIRALYGVSLVGV